MIVVASSSHNPQSHAPFTQHTGLVAPMDRSNVDTDQIIPKQFLKRIERTGFGQFLFFDWRFRDDGSDNPDFELNRPEYRGTTVLLARLFAVARPPVAVIRAGPSPRNRCQVAAGPTVALSPDSCEPTPTS